MISHCRNALNSIALVTLLLALGSCNQASDANESKTNAPPPRSQGQNKEPILDPEQIERLQPEVVHTRVSAGKALLVCAYESDIVFRTTKLDGAISLQEFQAGLPELPRQQEIIFYCS